MKSIEMENSLKEFFKKMVNRYNWLKIKFEWNELRNVYLISYFPVTEIEQNESFVKDAMEFEDKMNYLYGDYAPLFCDEEKYFKLSPDAEIIEYQSGDNYAVNIDISGNCELFNANLSWDRYDCWQNLSNMEYYQIAA